MKTSGSCTGRLWMTLLTRTIPEWLATSLKGGLEGGNIGVVRDDAMNFIEDKRSRRPWLCI
jgi:hypothetical protein